MTAEPLWQRYEAQAKRLARFLVVGGLAAVTYAGVCTLLVQAFPEHKAAIGIGVNFALIPIVFLAQRHVTFRSDGHWLRELVQYAGLQVVSITISTWTLVRFVTGNPYLDMIAFLAIAAFAAIITYVVCHSIIFRDTALGRSTGKH
jgi:putative flippase GtrA